MDSLLHQQQSPVLTDTFFPGTENVSLFFDESDDGRLPICTCGSLDEIRAVGQALQRKDVHTCWRKAALAAAASRQHGSRTDLGSAERTPIQELSRIWNVSTAYVSRLARVHTEFNKPDDPGITELIRDEFFVFKHFMVATTYAPVPKLALIEARQMRWSANALARFLAGQQNRSLIDAAAGRAVSANDDDDDLDLDWHGLQERARTDKPSGLKALPWRLTKGQHARLAEHLRDLSVVLGTKTDIETILATVERAHRELVSPADVSEQAA